MDHMDVGRYINNNLYLLDDRIIVLIANVKGRSHFRNKRIGEDRGITEFFSLAEFEEILLCFKHFSTLKYCIFFDEEDFMRSVLQGLLDKTQILVHNFSRSGSGIGKKALIPSFCDFLNIQYIGSDAYSAALCRNKYHYISLLKDCGFSIAPSWLYLGDKWLNHCPPEHGKRLIIKPLYESSSIGINQESIVTYNGNDHVFHTKVKEFNQPGWIVNPKSDRNYEV